MATKPIDDYSWNSLEEYTGQEQKFLDARLAKQIKSLGQASEQQQEKWIKVADLTMIGAQETAFRLPFAIPSSRAMNMKVALTVKWPFDSDGDPSSEDLLVIDGKLCISTEWVEVNYAAGSAVELVFSQGARPRNYNTDDDLQAKAWAYFEGNEFNVEVKTLLQAPVPSVGSIFGLLEHVLPPEEVYVQKLKVFYTLAEVDGTEYKYPTVVPVLADLSSGVMDDRNHTLSSEMYVAFKK